MDGYICCEEDGSMAMKEALRIAEGDSVAVALTPLGEGEVVTVGSHTVLVCERIPAYHKFALEDIRAGEKVFKYGEIIGEAVTDITRGSHVHVHNVRSLRG